MFVSLSQNSSVGRGAVGAVAGDELELAEQRVVDLDRRRRRRRAELRALGSSSSHDQVLRNHAVGSTWIVSASGPALVTRTVMSRSVGVGLGVVDLDDPVAVVVEGAGVEQLVLGVVLAPPAVLGDEVVVGERAAADSGSATG